MDLGAPAVRKKRSWPPVLARTFGVRKQDQCGLRVLAIAKDIDKAAATTLLGTLLCYLAWQSSMARPGIWTSCGCRRVGFTFLKNPGRGEGSMHTVHTGAFQVFPCWLRWSLALSSCVLAAAGSASVCLGLAGESRRKSTDFFKSFT